MQEKLEELFLTVGSDIVTTNQLKDAGILNNDIKKLISEGLLRREFQGIYIKGDSVDDEYYIYQLKHKNTVYSHLTAFYLRHFSERVPPETDVTTIKGNNPTIYLDMKVKIHWVTKERFDIGIEEILSPYGNKIKVYNLERCICDMVKYKHSYEGEIYAKIIYEYFYSEERNTRRLKEYSKLLGVEQKMKTIREVMRKW